MYFRPHLIDVSKRGVVELRATVLVEVLQSGASLVSCGIAADILPALSVLAGRSISEPGLLISFILEDRSGSALTLMIFRLGDSLLLTAVIAVCRAVRNSFAAFVT